MRKFMKRFFITILSGAWAVALLGGCVGEPAIPVGGANATTPSASVSAPAGTDAPPVKPFLWISPFVPSDIANAVYLPQGVSKVGDKASAGKLGDYTVGADQTVLLGDPYKFNADNIDDFDF